MWLDHWTDVLRYTAIFFSVVSLIMLARRFTRSRNDWNVKTRDLWFATVMWCVCGVVLPVEGLYEGRQLEPRLIFYFLASGITLKGLWPKGAWGALDE